MCLSKIYNELLCPKNLILVKEMIEPGLSSSMEKSDLSSE
ncbi:hypothetical protein Pint_00748 [Pistacia integerrima]|uniref:Uncharacterized protein n=1 Tax=Pistacia integerrima TaxID=434235 RepID=A0ACC0ZQF3_9ROSI|nr:hypothetical protein Pint_00748 [Pistacia integerrima]